MVRRGHETFSSSISSFHSFRLSQFSLAQKVARLSSRRFVFFCTSPRSSAANRILLAVCRRRHRDCSLLCVCSRKNFCVTARRNETLRLAVADDNDTDDDDNAGAECIEKDCSSSMAAAEEVSESLSDAVVLLLLYLGLRRMDRGDGAERIDEQPSGSDARIMNTRPAAMSSVNSMAATSWARNSSTWCCGCLLTMAGS